MGLNFTNFTHSTPLVFEHKMSFLVLRVPKWAWILRILHTNPFGFRTKKMSFLVLGANRTWILRFLHINSFVFDLYGLKWHLQDSSSNSRQRECSKRLVIVIIEVQHKLLFVSWQVFHLCTYVSFVHLWKTKERNENFSESKSIFQVMFNYLRSLNICLEPT